MSNLNKCCSKSKKVASTLIGTPESWLEGTATNVDIYICNDCKRAFREYTKDGKTLQTEEDYETTLKFIF